MQKNGLRPRAIGALSVVAASLFLLLCLANYGQRGVENAGEVAWHLGVAGWFVEVFGAGAFALVLLPLVWGLVVYFREDTPSLAMRAAGTLLLACSISMVSGLLQDGSPEMSWAGAVGEYSVALSAGLGGVVGKGFALALAWAAAVTLFMASLIWSTDWWFHTLRKGPTYAAIPTGTRIETEPVRVELLGDDDEDEVENAAPQEREVIAMQTAGADAVSGLDTEDAVTDELPAVEALPDGFSTRRSGERMVLRGPVGYQGIEFLPPSDELASPEPPEQRFLNDEEVVVTRVLDDEIPVAFAPPADEEQESRAAAEATEALFAEHQELVAEREAARIATIEETIGLRAEPTLEIDTFVAGAVETAAPQPAAEELPVVLDETIGDVLAEPVEEPAPERPRSGIGLPDDSPFVDEFFAVDVVVADAYGAGDGASADGEVEAAFGAAIPAGESPESTFAESTPPAPPMAAAETVAAELPEEPAPAPRPESGIARTTPVIVDELLFADAYDIVDDEIPMPIAARSAPPPAPAAVEDVVADGPPRETALDRIHAMQLDPLFHDAVEVVLDAGRGSAMSLQRRFGIGHGRGLRLLEQMEEAGILAAEDASGTREVLVARTAWEAFSGTRAS